MRAKTPDSGRLPLPGPALVVALVAERGAPTADADGWPLTGSLLGETLRGGSPPLVLTLLAMLVLVLGCRSDRVRDRPLPDVVVDDISVSVSVAASQSCA
jgi:hypothetical protein